MASIIDSIIMARLGGAKTPVEQVIALLIGRLSTRQKADLVRWTGDVLDLCNNYTGTSLSASRVAEVRRVTKVLNTAAGG